MTIIVEGQAQQPPVWPSTQGPNKLNIIWSPAALASARSTGIGPWTRTSWPGVCAFTADIRSRPILHDQRVGAGHRVQGSGFNPMGLCGIVPDGVEKARRFAEHGEPEIGTRAFNRGKTIRRRALGSPRAGVRSGVLSYL